jgi:hypothetical protein
VQTVPSHRTGLLIIRAWVERGSTDPLRANIRVTDDVSLGIEQTLEVAQPEGVSRIVDAWVRGLLDERLTDRGN